MGKFRSKVVEIDAVQLKQGMDLLSPSWFYEAIASNQIITHGLGKYANGPVFCEIATLEGTMRGDEGDWIIRGLRGEFYPCKPDVFAMKYEPTDIQKEPAT